MIKQSLQIASSRPAAGSRRARRRRHRGSSARPTGYRRPGVSRLVSTLPGRRSRVSASCGQQRHQPARWPGRHGGAAIALWGDSAAPHFSPGCRWTIGATRAANPSVGSSFDSGATVARSIRSNSSRPARVHISTACSPSAVRYSTAIASYSWSLRGSWTNPNWYATAYTGVRSWASRSVSGSRQRSNCDSESGAPSVSAINRLPSLRVVVCLLGCGDFVDMGIPTDPTSRACTAEVASKPPLTNESRVCLIETHAPKHHNTFALGQAKKSHVKKFERA